MNTVRRTHQGHWAQQKPFVMPTAEEIAAADEKHDMARANRATVPLLVLSFLIALALVVWAARFFLKG